MNESPFGCYESMFCTASLQPSEHTAIQQHRVDHDLQTNSIYFNGQAEMPVAQLKQQQAYQDVTVSAGTSNHQGVAGRDEVNLMAATVLNNVSNAATYSGPRTNIPFVQIHTTDVQPQRSNYGNVFRRAVTNHAEIKSEPIKSEAADSSKDRVNATPTPPVRNVSSNSNERIEAPSSPRNEDLSRPTDTAACESIPQQDSASKTSVLDLDIAYHSVRKCNQCRFICLDDAQLEEHVAKTHSSSSFNSTIIKTADKQIPCPGCSNVFFACKSLEIHLIEDHFASETDAKKLIEAVNNTAFNKSKFSTPSEPNITETTDEQPAPERKSRIYLKNVECLREPRREPLEMDVMHHNHLADGFYQGNTFSNLERHMDLSSILNTDFCDMSVQDHEEDKQHSNEGNTAAVSAANILDNRPKQKISIKSVDVLREPALLRRDFDIQNQFCNMANNCNELNFDSFNGFQPPSSTVNSENDVLCSVANGNEIANTGNLLDKPRRPKIYIKNVDILKEPIMLPTFSSNGALGLPDTNSDLNYNFLAQSMQQAATNSDFMNNASNMGVANQTYDEENMGQMAIGCGNIQDSFLYDNVANGNHHVNNTSNSDNSLITDLNGVGGPEGYQSFGNTNGTINTNFLNYPLMNCTGIDSPSHGLTTTPIITEPTPPPAPGYTMSGTDDALCNPIKTIAASTPPQQKQKIFIKNVDILKEPQFQEQRERGTLHLRTVDELNLMNRNEVESLIAPNLENNNVNSSSIFVGHSEGHTQIPEEDDVTERDMFYEEDHLKLQDYATQLVNNWSVDDYDLGDDIDCIITDSIEPINNVQATLPPPTSNGGSTVNIQKMIHDLDTPQVSMISIRDIDELTGPQPLQPQNINVTNTLTPLETNNPNHGHRIIVPNDSHTLQHDESGSRISLGIMNIIDDEIEKPCITSSSAEDREKSRNKRKQDCTNALTVTTTASIQNTATIPLTTISSSFNFNATVNLPPLTPVTNFNYNNKQTIKETTTNTTNSVATTGSVSAVSKIPIPPLVPVSTLVSFTISNSAFKSSVQTTNASTPVVTSTITTTTTTNTAPVERGRIYVANNLMQVPTPKKNITPSSTQKSNSVSVTGGTSVRGRPFGSNRTDNSNKARSETGEVVLKCSVRGCAFRFKKSDTLDYHKRCHDSNSTSSQAKLCPECKSTDFSNWNTLHTHLWRTHQIDMELYSCSQCPFKTPIYSRLVNTHTKIHSEERNYKCEQCGKAFKNTKQLKNHRRWHRTHSNVGGPNVAANTNGNNSGSNNTGEHIETSPLISSDLHRCNNCGAAFSHLKTLREHSCKKSDNQLLCSVCGHVASSKSSLKLHMFTHENSKRLKCSSCTYSTSDHNAFRRHKMTHENTKMYVCPHCSYKSIQSVTFQKHVWLKHPDSAPTLIHKCKICSYSTVNRTLFNLHQIKHKTTNDPEVNANDPDQSNSSVEVVEVMTAEAENTNSDCIILNSSKRNPLNKINNNNDENETITLTQQQKIIKVKDNLLNTIDNSPSTNECINIDWNETKPNSVESVINHDGT